MTGSGQRQLFGGTETNSDDGFLVLDRNGNGTIDNGTEMFGNSTPLSNETSGPRAANGFEALQWFDRPENGGNGDGQITRKDTIVGQLRIWFDRNHNGISEPDELVSLRALGVVSISLTTHISERRDRFGNLFKFRSKVQLQGLDGELDQTVAFDVFLTTNR